MSGTARRARRLLPAAVLALAMLPGVAAADRLADPSVPEGNLRDGVHDLRVSAAVTDLRLAESVVPLEEESTKGGTTTVRINADVLFDFGRATLTEAARRELGELAERLRGQAGVIRIAGFTDSVGTPAANLDLSRRRAVAVRDELQRRLGAGAQIQAVGRGEANPVEPNETGGKDNPAGRAKNRRVEITFGT